MLVIPTRDRFVTVRRMTFRDAAGPRATHQMTRAGIRRTLRHAQEGRHAAPHPLAPRALAPARQFAGLALPGRVSIPRRVPMSSSNGRNRGRPPYLAGKRTPWQPGDEQVSGRTHSWCRMYNRFRARLLRSFKRGKKSRQAAAATYDANRANLTGRPRSFGVPRDRPRDAVRHTVHDTVTESLPCSSIANCSRKACLKSNGTMRAACKTSCNWESVSRIGVMS